MVLPPRVLTARAGLRWDISNPSFTGLIRQRPLGSVNAVQALAVKGFSPPGRASAGLSGPDGLAPGRRSGLLLRIPGLEVEAADLAQSDQGRRRLPAPDAPGRRQPALVG